MDKTNDVRRYPHLPGDDVKTAFLEHVRETGQPETFPGICRSAPADGWDFEIVTPFKINPLRRPHADMAPCPVCSPVKPKFLEGVLVWDREEECLRAIGNECGSKETRQTRDHAYQRYYERVRQRKVLEDLRTHLPHANDHLRRADQLGRFTDHAERLKTKLKAEAPTFIHRVSDEVNRNGGQLSYAEQFTDARGRQDSVQRLLGAPKGVGFLHWTFRPEENRKKACEYLSRAVEGSGAEAKRWIAEHRGDVASLAACHVNLVTGLQALAKAEEELKAAREFLDPNNLRLIQSWATRAHLKEIACRPAEFGFYFQGPSKNGKAMKTYLLIDQDRLRPSPRKRIDLAA